MQRISSPQMFSPAIFQAGMALAMGMVAITGVASAAPPKKPNMAQFSLLVSRSPFTIKPTAEAREVVSPLERDWMLGSVRPSGEGWAVTLINKKDRKDRVRMFSGLDAKGFQIVEVKQNPQSYMETKVKIRKGSQTAWITYDEKLIKIRPSGAAKATAKKISVSGQTGTASARRNAPPIPGRSSKTKSTKRTRYVPKSGR